MQGHLGEGEEIVPVERPREALAIEHRICDERLGHTPRGVYVRKVELAAVLENAEGVAEDCALVGR